MTQDRRLEEGAGPVLGDWPPPTREWTVMVYMAGDNNLEEFGRRDLLEMKEVGSTPEVAVVAQFDRMQDGATKRYYLQYGTALDADVVDTLPETNTGDPRELAQFMLWAMGNYPAKRYALVLWNHGVGWKEDDVYRMVERRGGRPYRRLAILIRRWRRALERPTLFASTLETILARGIAFDDTSRDFLDNIEMRRAIDSALLLGQVPKLDLLGFDACLMSMIEVAYQVKDLARYVVGSQDTEPGAGWNYAPILSALVSDPTMGADTLSRIIVEAFAASYSDDEPITQSALATEYIDDVVSALDDLCRYVLDNPDQPCDVIIGRASRTAQRYSDDDYKDLYDLCEQIARRSDNLPELRQRAEALMALLSPPGDDRFIHAEAHRGVHLGRSHGVSIYYPRFELSPYYKRLDFAGDCYWDELLHFMLGV